MLAGRDGESRPFFLLFSSSSSSRDKSKEGIESDALLRDLLFLNIKIKRGKKMSRNNCTKIRNFASCFLIRYQKSNNPTSFSSWFIVRCYFLTESNLQIIQVSQSMPKANR